MTRINLMTAIDEALGYLDQDRLRDLLENKTDTIYRLATLKNKMGKNPSIVGICSEIRNIHSVKALSPTWKHFSGNSMYPVPGNMKNQDPEAVYARSRPLKSKWAGQQKRYRFSLINHLLNNAPAFYKAIEKRLK